MYVCEFTVNVYSYLEINFLRTPFNQHYPLMHRIRYIYTYAAAVARSSAALHNSVCIWGANYD